FRSSRVLSIQHLVFGVIRLSFPLATATSPTYTLSLHDALPICPRRRRPPPARRRGGGRRRAARPARLRGADLVAAHRRGDRPARDRKSTRLNSSHVKISYAVFCLKKKKINSKTKTGKGERSTGE